MAEDINFDFARRERIGLSEAVYCESKSVEQIAATLAAVVTKGESVLLTRLAASQVENLSPQLRARLDYDSLSRTAIFGDWRAPQSAPQVALVTAGSSDLRVAREAGRTLAFNGINAAEFNDVGVAGLWRLLERAEELRRFPVVIAVAGMEGALFSVIGGLVGGLLIALPTSVGYGVTGGGITALHAALGSCAPGVVTVNIDNGYGAACAALRALRMQDGLAQR
ncbi:MAG: nickel pincer cofactor biosynthesis protein LarB [Gammaproteobacteria bacterium]